LRGTVGLIVLVMLALVTPSPASAADFSACWVSVEPHPIYGTERQVTRCRIAGGATVDYASDTDVPSVLYPNMGTDLNGPCWYLTSVTTDYILITRYADGSADVGYDPDPTIPGGIIVVGPNLPRCTSEPTPIGDPATEAWDYVISYIHDPPTPELNPEPGQGVTGLATYLAVSVPDDHQASLVGGISAIDVEVRVDAVVVSWGDGHTNTYPPDPEILAGYPDGTATHIYEVKDADGFSIVVEYDWTARWRLGGGPWAALPVPNTTTTVGYPVAEVVSRLGD
jgi:hypothetical protein